MHIFRLHSISTTIIYSLVLLVHRQYAHQTIDKVDKDKLVTKLLTKSLLHNIQLDQDTTTLPCKIAFSNLFLKRDKTIHYLSTGF